MNRKKEYILIVAINIFFAFYTSDFLGQIPFIPIEKISNITYLAIFGWFMYGLAICLVLRWEKIEAEGWIRSLLTATGTSIVIILTKSAYDYISNRSLKEGLSQMELAGLAGGVTDIFGVILTVALFLIFVKGKKRWTKRAKKPAKWIAADIVLYILGIIWIRSEKNIMINVMGASEENILSADYYYAHGFLSPLNVWTYTFLMIMLWWLMRALYVEEDAVEIKVNEPEISR